MILYHAITAYHILKSAVHKLCFHPEEDAILLIPNFLVRSFSGLKNEQNISIFSKCISFTWEKSYPCLSVEEIYKEIEREFQNKTGYPDLSSFSEINVFSAAYYFGSWLVYDRKSFQWFEEADGRLSQPEPIMEDDARINQQRYELAVANGLYTGDNPYVLKKYIKKDAQLPDFYDPLAVNYDVMKEMNKLSQGQRELLLDFFDVPRDLSFRQNSAIMLTAHFCNIRVMTYEEHALCYQLTSDYYLDGHDLYYKVHPSDLMPYQSFMKNISIVPAHFPSELLTLVTDEPFEIGASVSSTGIYNLSSLYKRVLIFNQEYIKTFWHNHRYYFCVKIMEQFPTYSVCAIGINKKQMENMIYFGDVIEERKVDYYDNIPENNACNKSTLYLIGCQQDLRDEKFQTFFDSKRSSDIIVFLNEDNKYSFYNIMENVPFIIKELWIEAINKEELGTQRGCERVVIFTNDLEAQRKVEKMNFVKKLIQTEAELNVLATIDKDTQIVALRGMLKATEQQLQTYIEENNAMCERYQEMETLIRQQKEEYEKLSEQLKKYEGDDVAKNELQQEAAQLQAELELYNMKLANKAKKEEIEKIKAALTAQDS